MSARQNHWPAIVFLLTRGIRTTRQLEELTGAGRSSVVRTLSRLEDEGLVERHEVDNPGSGNAIRWRWVGG